MRRRVKYCAVIILCLGIMGCGNKVEPETTTQQNDTGISSVQETTSSSEGTEEQKTGNMVSLKEAKDDIEKALDALRDGDYANLSGDLPFVPFPEADNISSIQLIYDSEDHNLLEFVAEAKAFFSQFQNISEEYIYIVSNGEAVPLSTAMKNLESGEENYEDVFAIMYIPEGNGREMQYLDIKLHTWTNRGIIADLDDEIVAHPGTNLFEGEYYDLRNHEVPEVSVQLLNGEVSIKEAIETFNREINEDYYLENPNPDVTYQVCGVQVSEITKRNKGYRLYARSVYNGIPFDVFNERNSSRTELKDFEMPEMNIAFSEAMMVEKGRLDCTTECDRVCKVEERGDKITEMLPLTEVLGKLSEALTEETIFQVKSIDFVYCSDPSEEDEHETIVSVRYTPFWKITLQNEKDKSIMNFYTNILTGEIRGYNELQK